MNPTSSRLAIGALAVCGALALLVIGGCGGVAGPIDSDFDPGPAQAEAEPDGGASTGGVIGSDAGELDGGETVGGSDDAGSPGDGGAGAVDAGAVDAGSAGPGDGGTQADAGSAEPDDGGIDADAGAFDAGSAQGDAGLADAGAIDAGSPGPGGADAGAPAARLLDTSVVSLIVEPEGSGHDDSGASYTDLNYWNFCVPGAVTAALYYWKPGNVTGWAAGHFREPSHAPSTIPTAGTYWTADDTASGYHSRARSYLMYLAMQVKPPSYTAPGVASFATYPTTGAGAVDGRDALNWEASGHASNWSTFFYEIVASGSVTQAKLHANIKTDIAGGHAVVAFCDTGYLPNWSRSLSHAITIVGYDDTAGTYKYVDTCGKRCNGAANARNGGVWTISQAALTNAIKNGSGYIW